MVAENCLRKNEFGCNGRCKLPATLTDRTGETFTVVQEYGCRNVILNGKVLYFGLFTSPLRRKVGICVKKFSAITKQARVKNQRILPAGFWREGCYK